MENKRTIITVALTGSQGSKENNPYTPITCQEIIDDAYQCYLEGASIAHIHVKADDGVTPEINYEKFEKIKEGIRSKCNMLINFSTSGEYNHHKGIDLIGTADSDQVKRLKIIDSRPDIASYDIPTMNFNEKIFMNPLPFLRKLGNKMIKNGILPEIEIYSSGDIEVAKSLQKAGDLPSNVFYQLVLGVYGGAPANTKSLLHLVESLPSDAVWSAFGIGKNHLPILNATLSLGGHIRVGLEDNLFYSRGKLTSNVELVKRAKRIIEESGNKVASVEETQRILKI